MINISDMTMIGSGAQADKLRQKIMRNGYLQDKQRDTLLRLCEEARGGHALCHGDFHVFNVMQTSDEVKIIDWVDASGGRAEIDACRTYLLYLLHKTELSDAYLNLYCGITGTPKEDILIWLPLASGARLDENVTECDVVALLRIVNQYMDECNIP